MRWRHTDADQYHQWEEAEGRAEKWEKTAKEERKQHEWAISDIRAELRQEMAQMRREFTDEDGKCNIPVKRRGDVRYGDSLRTMAVALYDIGVMSIERIREMLNAMSGNILRISDGAVYEIIRGFPGE